MIRHLLFCSSDRSPSASRCRRCAETQSAQLKTKGREKRRVCLIDLVASPFGPVVIGCLESSLVSARLGRRLAVAMVTVHKGKAANSCCNGA